MIFKFRFVNETEMNKCVSEIVYSGISERKVKKKTTVQSSQGCCLRCSPEMK